MKRHLVEEFELKKNKKHRVLGIDLKNISTKFDQSKLRNKNLATINVLHVKTIVLYLFHVQWRHPVLKFW